MNHTLISGDGAGRICNCFENIKINNNIVLWKNRTGYLPQGKQHAKNIVKLAESSDKKLVYSVSYDGFLKVLDINEMKFM